MTPKSLLWFGMLVGSAVGGYVPTLWGAELISFAALFGSLVGSLAGIWAAYKLYQMMDG